MQKQSMDKMFGRIPDTSFRLFCGRARRYYAALLSSLSLDLFSAGNAVARLDYMDAVAAFTASWEFNLSSPGEGDDDIVMASGTPARAVIACRRLSETGWICERRDHYRRTVDIDPGARMLLDSLMEIESSNSRSYGGEVLGVLSQLEAARLDPENRSESVSNAAKSARSFLNHLRLVGATVRAAEEQVLRKADFRSMFSAFFDEFVSAHLIEDYQRLRTRSNPYRFRGRILDIADDMCCDDMILGVLAQSYVREGRSSCIPDALESIARELSSIQSTFRSLDAHLMVIEETAHRLEIRIGNAVRHMDRMAATGSLHIAEAFILLANSGIEDKDIVSVQAPAAAFGLPMSSSHLCQIQVKRLRAGPLAINRPVRSASDIAYDAALAGYAHRVHVTAEHIERYLLEEMSGRDCMFASELKISGLESFLVMERLRLVEYLYPTVSKHWSVEPAVGSIENEWIGCRDFVIKRKVLLHVQ